jgi:hypothetical protein
MIAVQKSENREWAIALWQVELAADIRFNFGFTKRRLRQDVAIDAWRNCVKGLFDGKGTRNQKVSFEMGFVDYLLFGFLDFSRLASEASNSQKEAA